MTNANLDYCDCGDCSDTPIEQRPKPIDSEPTLPPCAWCKRDVMDYLASFNGKDICADCEDEALEEANEDA